MIQHKQQHLRLVQHCARRAYHHSTTLQASSNLAQDTQMEGAPVKLAGGNVIGTTTSSRYTPRQGFGIDPNKRHILENTRKHRLIFKPDREILDNSIYPAEFPRTHVPVPEPEVPDTRGRRALNYLYSQFKEAYNRHRNTVWFNYIDPRDQMGAGAWIAPSATVVGNVWLGDCASVWYGAVLKGDLNEISIAGYSNIQDGVVISVTDRSSSSGENGGNGESASSASMGQVSIGMHTTVGHSAYLQSCTIGNNCIIGMNATVLEGAVVEDGSVVAAGSLVPPGRRIPSGELWAGKPARFIRKLGEHDADLAKMGAEAYYQLAFNHELEFTTHGTAYQYVEQMVRQVESVLPDNVDTREPGFNQWHKMGQHTNTPFWRIDREF